MDRTLSAPGKLFLAGEYAVLWGGQARIAAVEPRVQALVRPRDDRRVHVVLEGGRLSGSATPAGVRWDEAVTAPYRFVATALDLAYRLLGIEGPGLALALEASPASPGGTKLGLGSSARAVVLAAEAARVAHGADFDALKLALLAHADAQQGKGSGGDVAACFAGGVVRYRRYEVTALRDAAVRGGLVAAMAQASPVELLKTGTPVFPMLYAYSGAAASTPALVGEVERALDVAARRRFVEQSDAHGDVLERGLVRRDFGAVRVSCQAQQGLLDGLGAARHDGLARVLALADTFGCAGKQSGAGGGDGAVLFAPDQGARDALLGALAARQILAFGVSPAPGLQGEVRTQARLASWLDAL